MAYYTALIAGWNSGTQPPAGVTGTPLTALSTANKIIAINGWTVTGSVPAAFLTTGDKIFNCLDWTEFAALTAAQQTTLLEVCAIPGQLKGGTGSFFAGLIPVFYAGKLGGPTVTALTALAQGIVQPWWQAASGANLRSPVSDNDAAAAGLS